MAIIVTQTADNAYHVQTAFRSHDRDAYPLEVYQAIFDMINDTHSENETYELDVIAWCCDLSETTLQDCSEFEDTETLAKHLQEYTTVLHYDDETVWHLSY